MKLTVKFLQQKSACSSGMDWYEKNGKPDTVEVCITALCGDPKPTETLSYANWLLSKTLTEDNCCRYAIFAARQVLDIFEKQYPADNRPRAAVEAGEKYVITHNADDRAAARAAGAAARAAGSAEGEKMYRTIIAYGVDLLNQQKAAACRKHRKN